MAEAEGSGAAEAGAAGGADAGWAFVDLHSHTSASFDSLASPRSMVAAAARRGLTHLAITDHDTIAGALEAQAAAPARLTVLVGEEIRTADGDMIATFLIRAVEPGLSAAETIAAIREQGGLVGIPHPFDRLRGSLGHESRSGDDRRIVGIVAQVDWVEAWNARLIVGDGNARAAALAREAGLPGVAVSDAHTTLEVGVASTAVSLAAGDPGTSEGLLACLHAGPRLTMGRASLYVRAVTPFAKVVQRARGRGRIRAGA